MAVKIQQQLLDTLRTIDRPGRFCTSGYLPPTLSGLEVAGVGAIALPLGKSQAVALKKQSRQAPYGKGTKTLVDTDVRRVWEVDADQITLANPHWSGVVEEIVHGVQSELGLEKQKLNTHLYKLLLYESGSFFLPHRDGEKLNRMVATLVVVLPTPHKGGELVVRHEGREETVNFGPESRFQTQFAAFYADCEHEVRPVASGFRLALVYNLTLAKSKQTITAPTSSEHIAAVARILVQWTGLEEKPWRSGDGRPPLTLAVLLDHEYTRAGLAYDALKGTDRAKADVLFAAAHQSGCDASLALVTKWESGSAEPSGDYQYGYGRYGRRRRYGYGSEEDEDEDGNRGGHEMGEVYEESLTAEHFSDADGIRLAFGEIPLEEAEIVSATPLHAGKPDKEDFEGYTGNAGMTLERWYHRAAVLLWPAKSRFDVLCKAGVEAAIGGLEQMVRQWEGTKKGEIEALQQSCLEFAGRIISHWPDRTFASYNSSEDAANIALLPLLEKLGDASLVAAWLRDVLAKDVSVDPGGALGDVCKQHGWLTFQAELLDLFKHTSNETIERHARLLADCSLRKDKNADRKSLCAKLAQQIMSAVERWDPQSRGRDWRARSVDLPALLPPLAQAFIVLNEPELFERLSTTVLNRPKLFDFTTVQIPALLQLEPWLRKILKHPFSPLHRWLTAVVEELESRESQPPQRPANWRRESTTGCKCADCQELSRFLQDPNTETLRLPLAKSRRQHLHGIIDGNKLDTTHVTERRGRPFVLVCTKTNASYDRSLQAHQVDLDHLAKLRNLLDWHEGLRKSGRTKI